MPTILDGALKSKAFTVVYVIYRIIGLTEVLAFGGVVTAAAAWSIFGGDMFPAEPHPKGEPETWTIEEMKRWLRAKTEKLIPPRQRYKGTTTGSNPRQPENTQKVDIKLTKHEIIAAEKPPLLPER
ncbi:hypothetical protein Golomagni_07215 [Golovinomyces magnicellulatus]|nr:hypothetical protein Golomagni_07215 [Golovinomyces magnicellulatus]